MVVLKTWSARSTFNNIRHSNQGSGANLLTSEGGVVLFFCYTKNKGKT